MAVFSGWLHGKALELGGVEVLIGKLPQCEPTLVASWVAGVSNPSYRGQIALADVLGVRVGLIRKMMGLPYTEFSEWLVRKILAQGKLADFPRETDIRYTTLNKWISYGTIPRSPIVHAQIRDALIEWGDPTPPDDLMAQIAGMVNLSTTRRAKSSSAKITTPCKFSKIAT